MLRKLLATIMYVVSVIASFALTIGVVGLAIILTLLSPIIAIWRGDK